MITRMGESFKAIVPSLLAVVLLGLWVNSGAECLRDVNTFGIDKMGNSSTDDPLVSQQSTLVSPAPSSSLENHIGVEQIDLDRDSSLLEEELANLQMRRKELDDRVSQLNAAKLSQQHRQALDEAHVLETMRNQKLEKAHSIAAAIEKQDLNLKHSQQNESVPQQQSLSQMSTQGVDTPEVFVSESMAINNLPNADDSFDPLVNAIDALDIAATNSNADPINSPANPATMAAGVSTPQQQLLQEQDLLALEESLRQLILAGNQHINSLNAVDMTKEFVADALKNSKNGNSIDATGNVVLNNTGSFNQDGVVPPSFHQEQAQQQGGSSPSDGVGPSPKEMIENAGLLGISDDGKTVTGVSLTLYATSVEDTQFKRVISWLRNFGLLNKTDIHIMTEEELRSQKQQAQTLKDQVSAETVNHVLSLVPENLPAIVVETSTVSTANLTSSPQNTPTTDPILAQQQQQHFQDTESAVTYGAENIRLMLLDDILSNPTGWGIFVSENCPYSVKVLNFLRDNGLMWIVPTHSVADSDNQQLLKAILGRVQVPALTINDAVTLQSDDIISFLGSFFLEGGSNPTKTGQNMNDSIAAQKYKLYYHNSYPHSTDVIDWVQSRNMNSLIESVPADGAMVTDLTKALNAPTHEVLPALVSSLDDIVVAAGVEGVHMYLTRLAMLLTPTAPVVVYSADWCGACRSLKQALLEEGLLNKVVMKNVDLNAVSQEFTEMGGDHIPALALNGRLEFVGADETMNFLRYIRVDESASVSTLTSQCDTGCECSDTTAVASPQNPTSDSTSNLNMPTVSSTQSPVMSQGATNNPQACDAYVASNHFPYDSNIRQHNYQFFDNGVLKSNNHSQSQPLIGGVFESRDVAKDSADHNTGLENRTFRQTRGCSSAKKGNRVGIIGVLTDDGLMLGPGAQDGNMSFSDMTPQNDTSFNTSLNERVDSVDDILLSDGQVAAAKLDVVDGMAQNMLTNTPQSQHTMQSNSVTYHNAPSDAPLLNVVDSTSISPTVSSPPSDAIPFQPRSFFSFSPISSLSENPHPTEVQPKLDSVPDLKSSSVNTPQQPAVVSANGPQIQAASPVILNNSGNGTPGFDVSNNSVTPSAWAFRRNMRTSSAADSQPHV